MFDPLKPCDSVNYSYQNRDIRTYIQGLSIYTSSIDTFDPLTSSTSFQNRDIRTYIHGLSIYTSFINPFDPLTVSTVVLKIVTYVQGLSIYTSSIDPLDPLVGTVAYSFQLRNAYNEQSF